MIIQWKWQIQGIRFDKQSAWRAMDKGLWHSIETVIKIILKKRKCKMEKWLSEEALKIAEKRSKRQRRITEAENIKKRWQEYVEELYKKYLHDPDNHDGVITHLESDILECEVKWALGNITMNKTSGGDGIPAELFQILKDDAVKVLHSVCQQIWKTQQWPQDGKCQLSFQSQRRSMPKNVQTTTHCTHLAH